jgi:hypothetical protein
MLTVPIVWELIASLVIVVTCWFIVLFHCACTLIVLHLAELFLSKMLLVEFLIVHAVVILLIILLANCGCGCNN